MNRCLHCGALAFAVCVAPAHARFLSVDPVRVEHGTGRHFSRYAYAHNAPFSYIDPDGRRGVRPYHQGESAHLLPIDGPPIAIPPTEPAVVTAPFGMRRHPLTGESRLHNGTDFRAWQDTQVRATQNGQVRAIYSNGAGGNQILVDNHDGSLSGYAHVAADPGLGEGHAVARGEVIGRSDGSGRLTAPHLHYTYRPGTLATPADPATPPVDPMRSQLRRYSDERE